MVNWKTSEKTRNECKSHHFDMCFYFRLLFCKLKWFARQLPNSSRTHINLIQSFKCSRRNLLMLKAQLKPKSKKQRIVYHLVKVFDPVTKMDFQARFRINSVVSPTWHRVACFNSETHKSNEAISQSKRYQKLSSKLHQGYAR